MARHSGNSTARTALQFALSTLPFKLVLGYLLYRALERGNGAGEDDLFSLMDSTIVFLAFLISWTMFAVYLLVFVPKKRYLLERYLREGEQAMGDIIVEDPSKRNCLSSRKYGYAVYSHPTKSEPPVVVRKQVRVYQPFTRERAVILRLPNRPLSGQAKVDIEIDLSKMRSEKETTLRYIITVSIAWVLFALGGACFCVYQMSAIPEGYLMDEENPQLARMILYIVAGVNPFLALALNGIRYVMYHNWMVHKGASLTDEQEARKIKTSKWFGFGTDDDVSCDGSDQIPYSIFGEDKSYAGTVNSHSRSVAQKAEAEGTQSSLPVTSVEDDGTNVKPLNWTSV